MRILDKLVIFASTGSCFELMSLGFYILTDPETPTTLPTGDYDVPLMLAGKQFNQDGSLFSPIDERVSLYGDVITVNAIPWPYHQVEPRKYKFRLLDASVSRSFSLYLVSTTQFPYLRALLTAARSTRQTHPCTFPLLSLVQMLASWTTQSPPTVLS